MASAELIRPARSWTRLDGVDLLRGIAIIFVLMNHVNMQLLGAKVPYTRGLPAQLVYSLVWNGQFGVQIFTWESEPQRNNVVDVMRKPETAKNHLGSRS